jgi:hypothetical protein
MNPNDRPYPSLHCPRKYPTTTRTKKNNWTSIHLTISLSHSFMISLHTHRTHSHPPTCFVCVFRTLIKSSHFGEISATIHSNYYLCTHINHSLCYTPKKSSRKIIITKSNNSHHPFLVAKDTFLVSKMLVQLGPA